MSVKERPAPAPAAHTRKRIRMLELRDIKKDYVSGDTTVHALKGVSLQFRDSEFVAVLGRPGDQRHVH